MKIDITEFVFAIKGILEPINTEEQVEEAKEMLFDTLDDLLQEKLREVE